ncbi:MAG TPA: endolytic transglycosylase MltG [Fimbriimonadaceae bacterium]|nr:endolytic transglycosylase MltG [Fimbriimonadaceae bacterium]
MAKAKPKIRWVYVLGAAILLVGFGWAWLSRATQPADPGAKPFYVRFDRSRPLAAVLSDLDRQGVIRSYRAARILALLTRARTHVAIGTYRVGAAMSTAQLLRALDSPIHQMVRLSEHLWAARAAGVLEGHEVCKADEYIQAVHSPASFASDLPFKVTGSSLEGFLFPDTYDLPPLLGAAAVVERQLKTFDRKVYEPLGRPKNIEQILTKASLIELEVDRDEERPLVASVIENRLKKHMMLQIDASLNYGLGVWRRLRLSDYRTVKGPYNLYKHFGLPPGPICSPSLKSIEAAMHPAKTEYLFYVALPDHHSLFAKTVQEHEKNVAKRKAAIAAIAKAKGHA